MQPAKKIRIPKAIIYTPFPKIDEADYEDFLKDIFNNKTGTKKVNGLDLRYDSNAAMASWEGYKEHSKELDDFKDIHVKRFNIIFKEKKLNYKDQELYRPVNLTDPNEKVDTIFDDYNQHDVLFVHCHGNRDVIGTGGFILTPSMLAQNLSVLGLSKTDSPLIVVWSCNSGEEKLNCKSYADNLRDSLKSDKFGFQNVCVFGVDAKIELHKRARKANTLVTYEDKTESEVLRMYASPSPKQKFKEISGENDALWTQITNFNRTRSRLGHEAKEIAKVLDFNEVDHPKSKTKKPVSAAGLRTKRSGTQKYPDKQDVKDVPAAAKTKNSSLSNSSVIEQAIKSMESKNLIKAKTVRNSHNRITSTAPRNFIESQQEYQKQTEQKSKGLIPEAKMPGVTSPSAEDEGWIVPKKSFRSKSTNSTSITDFAKKNENQRNIFKQEITGNKSKNSDASSIKNRK